MVGDQETVCCLEKLSPGLTVFSSRSTVSSNTVTGTSVEIHVVSTRLWTSSWTEVKGSYFGLERTWRSRVLRQAEEKAQKQW